MLPAPLGVEIREPLATISISGGSSKHIICLAHKIRVLGNGYFHMQNVNLRDRSRLTVLFSFLLLTLSGGNNASEALKVSELAPDWILPNSRGEHISFYQDSGGQPAVLLFWATWCPYSAELMPKLQELRNELANHNVKFYALNIWEDGNPIAHMKENEFDFTLLLDADQVAKRYKVRGTPGLFVVNGDKSIEYIRGKDSSADEVYTAVKAALKAQLK